MNSDLMDRLASWMTFHNGFPSASISFDLVRDCRQALSTKEPAESEPVAWTTQKELDDFQKGFHNGTILARPSDLYGQPASIPLYLAPPSLSLSLLQAENAKLRAKLGEAIDLLENQYGYPVPAELRAISEGK